MQLGWIGTGIIDKFQHVDHKQLIGNHLGIEKSSGGKCKWPLWGQESMFQHIDVERDPIDLGD